MSFWYSVLFAILKLFACANHRDHKYNTESLHYVTADIHSMGPFGLMLAPQPCNKLER
jgi:hypothetical protein